MIDEKVLTESEKQEKQELLEKELLKISNVYHTAFTSDNGSKVLQHLSAILGNSNFNPNVIDMDSIKEGTAVSEILLIHEGQRQVIRYISALVKYYSENIEKQSSCTECSEPVSATSSIIT